MTFTTADLEKLNAAIAPVAADQIAAAEARQLSLTKPPGALADLETIGNRLCGVAGCCPPPLPDPARVVVFAADHGVYAQGVTPWPQEVTLQMAPNIVAGGAGVNAIAQATGCQVQVIDVGMKQAVPGVTDRRVRPGTDDIAVGPAMSVDEAVAAIGVGVTAAREAVAAGVRCLLPGEVGLANTTVAAALIAVFTGADAAEVTGSGAGAQGEMLTRKQQVVAKAIETNQADAAEPLAALAKVGGLEHAAIVGLILGAAEARVPVILDGVISASAALVARAMCPAVAGYLFAGHAGAEPGIRQASEALKLKPLLDLGLRLGEGSGAVLAVPILRAAAHVLRDMASFDSAGVSEA